MQNAVQKSPTNNMREPTEPVRSRKTDVNASPDPATSRSVVRISLVALIVIAGLFAAQTAFAGSGSVRYSYEKVEIGSESLWTLVPHAESKLTGKLNRTLVRKAFRLLKSKKSRSYGDTSLSLSGSSPDDLVATVQIDPDYKQYSLVIMSEVVYTLTGLGVSTVKFPGYADGAVTRADIPLSSYTLTIPLFRALPEKDLVDARIRLPDGTVLPAREVYRRWDNGDERLVSAMFEYLDSENRYTVQWVLQKLPKLDIGYVDEVTPLLDHDVLPIRREALKALANQRNQPSVLKAVAARVEKESNDELARKAAEFLGKSDDRDFQVIEQFYLLENGSDKEAVAAAKRLGGWSGDDRVVEHLNGELVDDRMKLAKQAAASLTKLDAHQTMASALSNKKVASDIKMQIARDLAGDSKPTARLPGLKYLATHLTGREARQQIRAMRDLQVDGARQAIESFLTDENARIRATAADVLREPGSAASLSAMAAAIENLDAADDIEDAGYKLLVEKPTSTILKYTDDDNSIVQRMAFRALGTRAAREGGGSSEVFETLREGSSSSDPLIRGAAARGLGAIGNERALTVLKDMIDDSSPKVRRDVAFALGNYEKGTLKSKLVEYLSSDDPQVVAAAITTFEKRGASHVWDRLNKLADSEHPEVQAAALSALATLCPRDSEDKVSRVISRLSGALSGSQNDTVVLAAIEALGQFHNKNAVNSLAIQVNSSNKQYRAAAVRALAATGQPQATDLVVDVLNDESSEVRLAAVRALRKLKAVNAVSALKDRLEKEKNKEIRGEIESTLKQL